MVLLTETKKKMLKSVKSGCYAWFFLHIFQLSNFSINLSWLHGFFMIFPLKTSTWIIPKHIQIPSSAIRSGAIRSCLQAVVLLGQEPQTVNGNLGRVAHRSLGDAGGQAGWFWIGNLDETKGIAGNSWKFMGNHHDMIGKRGGPDPIGKRWYFMMI